ncbi:MULTISPECIES: hypothetical protein [Leptospira]|nr:MULTISPECIES: hypothetical protein [Leptospira]EMJ61410.1 hypothetical protein LEP1GSC051_2466 [Leptospira sp. P2653]MDL5245853.1 hypothetical protein [Leptospira weilii]
MSETLLGVVRLRFAKNTARANISFLERVDFIRKLLEEISRITPIEKKK